jgi:hypothetical protein
MTWYPDNLAWHMNFSRAQLRKLPMLNELHEFIKKENAAGSITRQEAVSMIPPLFLDVKPHHYVRSPLLLPISIDVCLLCGLSRCWCSFESVRRPGTHEREQRDSMRQPALQRC